MTHDIPGGNDGREESRPERLSSDRSLRDELLAELGHELRNPLSALRCALDLLRDAPNDQERAWPLAMAERQLVQLARLVDDLLDHSHAARGKLAIRPCRVALTECLADALTHARSLGQRAFELEIRDEPLFVHADPARLLQVLENLLSNAVRYTADGGRIRVRVTREPCHARVAIEDDGVGIEPSELQRIFEPFQQGRSGRREGFGLGLSIVRSLTELHGGVVRAESEGPGRGSSFVLEWPLSVASSERRCGGGGGQRVEAPRPGLRVLVVDDHRDSAQALGLLLEGAGYAVETAFDGASALASARARVPLAILCDLCLPDVDGTAIARSLRAEGRFATTLMVAVSGHVGEEAKSAALAAGFDRHMPKPIEALDLLARLARHARAVSAAPAGT